MIIDFRLRPPFGKFAESYICSNVEFATQFASRFKMPLSESVKQRSIELCIQEMDEARIDIGVVPGRKCFGLGNDDLIELMERYPNRLICFADIDPHDDAKSCIEEIMTYAVNGPCTGVVVEPALLERGTEPMTPDDSRLYPIYEICQEKGLPLMMSFGGLTQSALRYLLPMDIDNVAEHYPNLKIILAHGGFPWAGESCWVALRRENVYVSPDIYAMNGPGAAEYIAAANGFIPEKILFGSAYPITPMKNAVDYYLNCGIEEAYLPKIMYQNAAKILGLTLPE